ncbi:MAG: zinc ABC transporter substrate-binding protein, partial [Anaerolineales bacterium]|nr:zinc ABC transporter substrate-binding protein [Anaerolineales bacterium]
MRPLMTCRPLTAVVAVFVWLVLALAGCSQPAPAAETAVPDLAALALPDAAALDLNGRALRVVATTSIVGDVVKQVGGDAIDLTTLMGPGQDPHSYEPSANDLTSVAQADVIFVNGWDLEEALVRNLAAIGGQALVAPVSANITPRAFNEANHADEHDHGAADPHTWFAVPNVEQWTRNVEQLLSELDPAHQETYAANAAAYLAQLAALQTDILAQVATIPPEKRVLVTNHESLGYFADEYGFELLGTVIPAMSTMAEPSASDVSNLIAVMAEHSLCTVFTETTVSDKLAQTVADELSACDTVNVVPLFTGSVGPAGSGADSYLGMMRA